MGIIWVFGYGGMHFFERHAGLIWMPLVIIGGIGSYVIGSRFSPTKDPSDAKIGYLWLVLWAYAGLWLFLLRPFVLPEGQEWDAFGPDLMRRVGAYRGLVPMFAFVVGGI